MESEIGRSASNLRWRSIPSLPLAAREATRRPEASETDLRRTSSSRSACRNRTWALRRSSMACHQASPCLDSPSRPSWRDGPCLWIDPQALPLLAGPMEPEPTPAWRGSKGCGEWSVAFARREFTTVHRPRHHDSRHRTLNSGFVRVVLPWCEPSAGELKIRAPATFFWRGCDDSLGPLRLFRVAALLRRPTSPTPRRRRNQR